MNISKDCIGKEQNLREEWKKKEKEEYIYKDKENLMKKEKKNKK